MRTPSASDPYSEGVDSDLSPDPLRHLGSLRRRMEFEGALPISINVSAVPVRAPRSCENGTAGSSTLDHSGLE